MTPAQKKSRENFKKAVAEAKKLRAKNPKLSQAQAVKQAWAILYSTGKMGKTTTKKKATKKAAYSTHKDTKSHNVNIRVVSGIGALPVGMTGSFFGVPFKVYNQYDIYGSVTAIIENTKNGSLITEINTNKTIDQLTKHFVSYIKANMTIDPYQYKESDLNKQAKNFISDLYREVKNFNAGKTSTTKPKKGLLIKPKKNKTVKKTYTGKTTKESLKQNLKSEGLKLTHGYNLAARKVGYIGALIIKKYTLSEIKKLNPVYFEKNNDKFFGVYKRKLMISSTLNSQVMIEAHKKHYSDGTINRNYTVRKISSSGQIMSPQSFETLLGASNYIGKNIIL